MSLLERFSSPFQPLELGDTEISRLEELAKRLITPVMEQFEDRLQDPHRHVDLSRWKMVKEREDVHVYKERPMDSTEGSELPVLLTVGNIQGSLYDAMYAVTNPTTDSMRIKSAYIQDGVINAAVLARLREPTMDDPFRSLSIKWSVKGQARHLRTLVNNRDVVYMEATGLTRLPKTGELVGYQLLHSLEFPQTHSILGCKRGKLSIVSLYRENGKGAVELFGKGFVDPSGRIARPLFVKCAVDAMLSSWRTIQTAQRKKLAFALRTSRRRGSTSVDEYLESWTKECCICSTSLSSMAPLTFGKKRSASHCELCMRVVCVSCRVKKELAWIDLDGVVDMHSTRFCVACVHRVTKTSAFDIAVEELVHRCGRHGVSVASSQTSTETRSDVASETLLHVY